MRAGRNFEIRFDLWVAALLLISAAGAQAQISVTVPNGAEIWQAGTTQKVEWIAYDTLGDVVVYATNLTTDESLEVGQVPASAQAINWLICPLFGDGPCLITVTWLGPEGYEDSSDQPCTIEGSAENVPIVVTGPNNGESFPAGSTQMITWTGGGPGQIVQLDLLKGGEWMYSIGTAPVEAGSFAWEVCPDLPEGNDYIVDLRTYGCGNSTEDISDAGFAITASAPGPTITLLSPNGGESFVPGSTQSVTWTSTGLEGDAQVFLASPTDTIYIGAAPVAAGSFAWQVCPLLPDGSDYRIYLRGQGCWMSADDESDAVFSLAGGSGGPLPTLELTYPVGGEIWVAGTVQTVTWSSSDPVGEVRIVLYDGAQSVVDTLVPLADGSYPLTLPGNLAPGMSYQLILSWYGCGPELYAASARFFVAAPGDLDADGDVDSDDYANFRSCMTGPAILQLDPACAIADLDQDHDVDAADFGLLQRCFGGPGVPPRPGCLD